jgi:hypothetical protein
MTADSSSLRRRGRQPPDRASRRPVELLPRPERDRHGRSESELERHLPNKTQLRRMARSSTSTSRPSSYCAAAQASASPGPQPPGAAAHHHQRGQSRSPTATSCGNITARSSATRSRPSSRARQGEEAAAKWKDDYSELDEVRVIVYFCDGKLLKIEPDWLLDTNESPLLGRQLREVGRRSSAATASRR